MYAPVVLRFNTYGAVLSPAARTYCKHALADLQLQEWVSGARAQLSGGARSSEPG
jgi:glutathione S-transferase